MSFFKKIQNLPEKKRKIILWLIVTIVGLILFGFWVENLQQKLKMFEGKRLKEEFRLPSLQEKLKEMPKIELPEIEMPKISEQELEEIEKQLKEYGQ